MWCIVKPPRSCLLLLCIFKFTCQAGLKPIPAEPCFLDSLDKNPIPVLVIHCSGVGTAHKCPWAVTHPSGCEWQPEVPPWPWACSTPPPAAEGAGWGTCSAQAEQGSAHVSGSDSTCLSPSAASTQMGQLQSLHMFSLISSQRVLIIFLTCGRGVDTPYFLYCRI